MGTEQWLSFQNMTEIYTKYSIKIEVEYKLDLDNKNKDNY